MYEALAILYDKFTDDINYDSWVNAIQLAIKEYGTGEEKILLDLACGTGSISCPMAKLGYSVTAIDISQEMLIKAGENMRRAGVSFVTVCQDISCFSLHKPCDVIVCACDGVNYLTEDNQLTGFFNSCKAALKPGGLLIFDVSSEEKLMNTLGNKEYFDLRDDGCVLWQNHVEGRIVTLDLTVFAKQADGSYARFDEVQHQRMYTKDEITRAAAEHFNVLDVSKVAFNREKDDSRLQFICKMK